MTQFVLQPCKLRRDRLVPTKDAPISFEWDDLVTRLAPSGSVQAKRQLRGMSVGAFVGTTADSQENLRTFLLLSPDRTGKINWLLKQDPKVADRLREVFRVESVTWEDRLQESA